MSTRKTSRPRTTKRPSNRRNPSTSHARPKASLVSVSPAPVRASPTTSPQWTVVNNVPVPTMHARLAARSGTGATLGAVLGAVLLGPTGAILGAALGGGLGAASAAD